MQAAEPSMGALKGISKTIIKKIEEKQTSKEECQKKKKTIVYKIICPQIWQAKHPRL